ncbi:MAG: hypothetical protein JWO62_772 [Acidimicrobiaceae bacterium]|nr:hypothetical protein [Acidimicrobiaceae bacterium]
MKGSALKERVPERRRFLAVGLVAVVLVLGGVANTALRPRDLAPSVRFQNAVASSVVTDTASSSAWYCAGPLPIGASHGAASIAVTNLGGRTVDGEIVVASSLGGRPSVNKLEVQPGSESVLGLSRKGARGSAAATVLANGSGIAVEELVHGASGVSASPCTDRTSAVDYLASGSTLGASNLSLAVFDPGATPAVVGVSFVTSSGPISPPAFQGLSVGAGQLQVLNVGHYLPEKAVVATIVTATGGHVVAGALVTAVTHRVVLSSVTTATPSASSSWLVPAVPTGSASTSTFNVLNPGSRAAKVLLRLGTSSAGSELTTVVPPHAVVALTPGGEASPGAMRWASVKSTGAAVVVSRETVVSQAIVNRAALKLAAAKKAAAKAAAAKASRAARAAKARVAATQRKHGSRSTTPPTTTTTTTTVVPYATVSALPIVQPGVAVTSGVSAPATRWVLPGGESDATTSEVVVIDNTSRAEARVRIDQLDGSGSGPFGSTSFPAMPPLSVAPGAILTVDMATVVGGDGALAMLVSSSQPIVAGELLYSRKAPGFTLPTAIAVR